MPKVIIKNLALSIEINPAYSLLNNFIINEAPIHTVCGGNANCGCCRIRILESRKGMTVPNSLEIRKLGPEMIADGWRLSCQAHTLRDIAIHMPTDEELEKRCQRKKKSR